MGKRRHFTLGEFEYFSVELNGERFGYHDCAVFAEIAYLPADIHQVVFKTRDGRFIQVVTVAEEDSPLNTNGIRQGWYVANFMSKDQAEKVRASWAVLREQPPEPSGPWS